MRAWALASSLLLAGCETAGYLAQAARGQLEILAAARPVEELLAEEATPQTLRSQLELAQRLRDFAERELGLPAGGAYRRYAALDRPYALWNVVATPEFALEPVLSCFPIAGCVSYRGFFSRPAAERHASRLRAEGHDVYVYGVAASSTLGYFADPLLSTFIGWPEASLARLVFHELAHRVAYVRDDTSFNESFAVVVEREGLRRWLTASGRPEALAEVERSLAAEAEFAALVARTRAELAALYGSALSLEDKRRRKKERLAALAEEPSYRARIGRLPREPDNAVLAALATYETLVPAFERLLARAGGRLERFYAEVRRLAATPKPERDAELARLVQESGRSTTLR